MKNYSESLMAVLKNINTVVTTLEYKDKTAVVKCTMSKDDFEACKLILQDLENELETIKINDKESINISYCIIRLLM